MPVAVSTAMTAVSRHWAKLRPAHARSSRVSSPGANTGTSLSATRGGAAPCTATDQIFRRTSLVSCAFPASAGLAAGLPHVPNSLDVGCADAVPA
jgi:hypothetical protein